MCATIVSNLSNIGLKIAFTDLNLVSKLYFQTTMTQLWNQFETFLTCVQRKLRHFFTPGFIVSSSYVHIFQLVHAAE